MIMFHFTSTTMHVILNVQNAIYLHDAIVKMNHAASKNIVMSTLNKDITLYTSLTESNIDVGDIGCQLQNNVNGVVKNSNNKGSVEYYTRDNSKSKSALQKLYQTEGIAYIDKNTRYQLEESLASNYERKNL